MEREREKLSECVRTYYMGVYIVTHSVTGTIDVKSFGRVMEGERYGTVYQTGAWNILGTQQTWEVH